MKWLTTANSISDMNTNTVHEDIQMSIPLTYETGGRDRCDCVLCVAVIDTVTRKIVYIMTAHRR